MLKINSVVLAGGQSRRMSGKVKPLQKICGQTMLSRVVEKVTPLVNEVFVSTGNKGDHFADLDLNCIPDIPAAIEGPALGILSALSFHKQRISDISALLCVPADVPCFPSFCLGAMIDAHHKSSNLPVFLVVDGTKQPLFSIWPISCLPALTELIQSGNGGVKYLLSQLDAVPLSFSSQSDIDFVNVNTLNDLADLELRMRTN